MDLLRRPELRRPGQCVRDGRPLPGRPALGPRLVRHRPSTVRVLPVLVVVAFVRRMAMAVVDVVDVVSVPERRVTAVRAVFVVMSFCTVVSRTSRAGAESRHGTGEEERPDGEQHDRAARGDLRAVGHHDPAHAADDPDEDCPPHGRPEAAGEQLRCRVGEDHQRADEEQPDDPHRDDDGHCGEHGEEDVVAEDGDSHRVGVLLVVGDREEPRPQEQRRRQDHHGERGEDDDVAGARREDRPEEVPREVGRGARARPGDEHHAQRDTAVEHHRERRVPARAARGADELDGDRGGDRGDEGGEHRRLTGEDAHGDTRQGDVPHSVTDEGHAALDEEDPDERRREPGQQGGEQRLAHEVQGQQVGHGATSRGVGSRGAAPMTCPRRGVTSSGWWWSEPAPCPARCAAYAAALPSKST